ncbi:MAG: hypothetical protein M1457_11460, partial [bacterium]|nr:hypothetical protein [bacterium]
MPLKRHDESEPAANRLRRREFLLGGVRISLSFVAFDLLALPGQAQSDAGGSVRPALESISLTAPPKDAAGRPLDDSLEMMAAYLVQYAPPAAAFPASGTWKATYDIVQWVGSPNYDPEFYRQNRRMGSLAVARKPAADGGVDFAVESSTN